MSGDPPGRQTSLDVADIGALHLDGLDLRLGFDPYRAVQDSSTPKFPEFSITRFPGVRILS